MLQQRFEGEPQPSGRSSGAGRFLGTPFTAASRNCCNLFSGMGPSAKPLMRPSLDTASLQKLAQKIPKAWPPTSDACSTAYRLLVVALHIDPPSHHSKCVPGILPDPRHSFKAIQGHGNQGAMVFGEKICHSSRPVSTCVALQLKALLSLLLRFWHWLRLPCLRCNHVS